MIALTHPTVAGRRARVWSGGDGPPLLLIHGAWGGAALHFTTVWDALALRFRVIAPDLPGIGDLASPSLPALDAYADWLAALLDALDARDVVCAGNSLGAMIAWQLSSRASLRGLALVNGPPPSPSPPPIRALVAHARPLARALYRRLSFSRAALRRAFADLAHVPSELARAITEPPRAQLDALVTLVGDGARPAPTPSAPIVLLWGEADCTPGTRVSDARRLGHLLTLLPSAGHCPQLEQPAQFARALTAFAAGS